VLDGHLLLPASPAGKPNHGSEVSGAAAPDGSTQGRGP
jgi:hypothetical protein